MNKISNKVLLLSVVLSMAFFTACRSKTEMVSTESKGLTIYIASNIHYLDKSLYDSGEAFQKYTENANDRNFLYIDEVVDAFAL